MATVYLVPKKGVKVPRPQPYSGFLDPAGESVEMGIYWQRIINAGDAVIGTPPAAAPAAPAKAAKSAPATPAAAS